MNGTQTASSEQQVIGELASRLMDDYAQVEPTEILSIVSREYARFAGSPIRDFIPLFVERNAKSELSKVYS